MFQVFMLDTALDQQIKLARVSTVEQADDLVDEYSEKFPNAYVDYLEEDEE
jgi:hypothetical protein